MKPEMKYRRQDPSSNYKVKYLSPGSATVRYNRLRLQRKTMKKKIRKFYQKTKVELPDAQSKELCKLIGAIENSAVGRKELECIEKEGNQYLDKDGISSGTILTDVWRKDRESFFKDQMKNETGKRGNRWSIATIRMALAVYSRCPSAYEALCNLNILQLPCSKVLKRVLKEGSEKPGVDEEYMRQQHEKFCQYKKQREAGGFPQPLGLGILMWDEVKIQMKVAWNFKSGGITGFTLA
ncbi:PREDICTED: uncharacterized protein LOC107357534 [Acropora digitifera]|uniref:uncharacterized protein LOC107357534 n=1 Tax=Acropora digitifera TaxID=70779 RepID=UPI00077A8683|nr:PREDICTED: uncharacterized protein LOC107357534 [Acropora digitifera]